MCGDIASLAAQSAQERLADISPDLALERAVNLHLIGGVIDASESRLRAQAAITLGHVIGRSLQPDRNTPTVTGGDKAHAANLRST